MSEHETKMVRPLLIVRKQSYRTGTELDESKADILRKAYGRFAQPRYRTAGDNLTRILQMQGRWIACDCATVNSRHPLLFPVMGGGLQREDRGDGVAHAESCDFFKDAASQGELVRSYGKSIRPNGGRLRFRLVSQFQRGAQRATVAVHQASTHRSRPGLARLLCELLSAARLDRIEMQDGPPWDPRAQATAIREAAAGIDIARGVALDRWLALSLGELQELKARIAGEREDWGGARPHGIFLSTFDTVADGKLYPNKSTIPAIEVEGTLSIFGEGEVARRHPYLVIGLITKDTPEADTAAVVRAYAHPCVSWRRLTLVDSELERKTLTQILKCRRWLHDNFRLEMEITKPLFDMGQTIDATEPRELCLPDFVLRSIGHGVNHPTIVVETMGYDGKIYRDRKERLRDLFTAIDQPPGSNRTPLIEHDRFLDGDPDDRFWKTVRWHVTKLRPGASEL